MASIGGSVLSLALMGGLAFWGYRLAVRDVAGVPVIRALEGPMRVAPQDPGGETASYQGLAVNRVAAEGEAAPPPDRLVLAPRPILLAEEDAAVAALQAPEPAAPAPAAPIGAVAGQAAANEAASGEANEAASGEASGAASGEAGGEAAIEQAVIAALEPPAQDPPAQAGIPAPPQQGAALPAEAALAQQAPPDGSARIAPGLRPAPRPVSRPSRAAAAPPEPAAAPAEIDPARLKAGAPLVQLGAFDDAETARREWQRLSARFGTYLAGKSLVVQAAQSGGRSFYRLRAAGFSDAADARRFCSALLAEQAACIPVPVR